MLFVVIGMEQSYGGMNGIYEAEVIEAQNLTEAEDYGYELSLKVQEDYGIFNDVGVDELEWDEYMDMVDANAEFYVWEITKETNDSLDKLTNDLNADIHEFIKEFCGDDTFEL